MDAHAHDHHGTAEPDVEQNWVTGLGLGLGILAQIVALVGAIRGSTALLDAGAVLGILGLAAGVFGLGLGATGGKSARGTLVCVVTSVMALVLWLTTQAHI